MTDISQILLKEYLNVPSNRPTTAPYYTEVEPYNNYVIGDDIFIEPIPDFPLFISSSKPIEYSELEMEKYEVDTTGVLEKFTKLKLTHNEGSIALTCYDKNDINVLMNGFPKCSVFINDVFIPCSNEEYNYIFHCRSGYLSFYGIKPDTAQISFVRYKGKKGMKHLPMDIHGKLYKPLLLTHPHIHFENGNKIEFGNHLAFLLNGKEYMKIYDNKAFIDVELFNVHGKLGVNTSININTCDILGNLSVGCLEKAPVNGLLLGGNADIRGKLNLKQMAIFDDSLQVKNTIKTSKYLTYCGSEMGENLNIEGNTIIKKWMDVYGNTHLYMGLLVDGNCDISGYMKIKDILSVGKNIECSGDITVSGNMTISKNIKTNNISGNQLDMKNIVSETLKTQTIEVQNIVSREKMNTGSLFVSGQIEGKNVVSETIKTQTIEVQNIVSREKMNTGSLFVSGQIEGKNIVSETLKTQTIDVKNIVSREKMNTGSLSVSKSLHVGETIESNKLTTENLNVKNNIETDGILTVKQSAIIHGGLSSLSVTTGNISSNQLKTKQIQTDEFISNKIQTNEVITKQLQSDDIINKQLQTNTITTKQIQTNELTTSNIQTNTITTKQVQTNDITTSNIQTNTITTKQLQTNDITTKTTNTNSITGKTGTITLLNSNNIITEHLSSKNINGEIIKTKHIDTDTFVSKSIKTESIHGNNLNTDTITTKQIHTNKINSQTMEVQNMVSRENINTGSLSVQQNIITSTLSANNININQSIQTEQLIVNNSIKSKTSQNETSISKHIETNSLTTKENINAGTINIREDVNAGRLNVIGKTTLRDTIINGVCTLSLLEVQNKTLIKDDLNVYGNINILNVGVFNKEKCHLSTDLFVDGNFITKGNITCQDVNINGKLDIKNNVNVHGNLYIDRETFISSNLTVKGETNIKTINVSGISLLSLLDVKNETHLHKNLIVDGGIRTSHIDISSSFVVPYDLTVNGNTMCNNIQSSDITCGNIKSSDITCGNIKSSDITCGNIKSSDITCGNIKSSDITCGNIKSSDITCGNIKSSDITCGNIKSSDITCGNVYSKDIKSSDITCGNVHSKDIKSSDITCGNINSYGNIICENIQTKEIKCEKIDIPYIEMTKERMFIKNSTDVNGNLKVKKNMDIYGNLTTTGNISLNGILGTTETPKYKPDNNIWKSYGTLFDKRYGFSYSRYRENEYIIGGFTDKHKNDIWHFNGTKWTEIKQTKWAPRYYHSSIIIDGIIYVFGGESDEDKYNDLWKSEDGGHTWEELMNAPTQGISNHTMEHIGNYIYILCGMERKERGEYIIDEPTSNIYIYNLKTNNWRVIHSSISPRLNHSSCILDGKIYVIGGKSTEYYNNMYVSDDMGKSWKQSILPFSPRMGHKSIVIDNKICVMGGIYYQDETTYTLFNDIWEYSGIWSEKNIKDLWTPRADFGISVYENKIYVVGGVYIDDGIKCREDMWKTGDTEFMCKEVLINGDLEVIGDLIVSGKSQIKQQNIESDTVHIQKYLHITEEKEIPLSHVRDSLYVNGTVSVKSINQTSDIRLKKNIQPIKNSIESILKLDGVHYEWLDSDKQCSGFIAQEVQNVLPHLVHGEDQLSIDYIGIIPYLVESIKQLKAECDELKKQVTKC
jgi:hypothetical protein